jgi:AraC-like DNA-binding protein
MRWLTGFFDTLILLGAIQGFIVSGLLYRRSHLPGSASTPPPSPAVLTSSTTLSHRLLATLLFLLALACLDIFLTKQPWVTNTTAGAVLSAIIPMIIIMPVGPLIFFYVRSCLDPAFRIGRRERRHFYPAVIDIFPQVLAIGYIIGLLTGVLRKQYHLGTFIDEYDTYSDIPRWISLVTYLWLSARLLSKQGKAGDDGQEARLVWPRKFIRIFILFSAVWLIFLLPYEIPRYSGWLLDTLDWYPIYLPVVFMIYWLGVKGYFISHQGVPYPKDIAAVLPERTTRPSLLPDTVDQVIHTLKRSMEKDQLWLNPDLNLAMLAQYSSTSPKILSTVLNQYMNKTFNEFINEYRVQEVKKRLLLPESRSLTIAGLAYECGFNSLPTFQRAFKSVIGHSPKEFLSLHASPSLSSKE